MSTPVDTLIREQGGLPPQQTMEEFKALRKNMMQDIETLLQNNMNKEAADMVYSSIIKKYYIATMSDTKEIYAYNGSGIFDSNGENIIHEQVCKMYEKHYSLNTFNQIKSRIQGVTYTEREEFNKDIDLIAVENGILNLKTKEIKEFTPEIKFTFKIPIKYNPEANCERIDKFIKEVFKPEDIPLAYEIIAYCLWRGMPIHKAFMLLGEGKNGKTTYLNLITNFLGDDNISTRTIQDLVYNQFASSSLYGKLANISDDLPNKTLKQTGHFKMLTGGGVLSYEKKHKDATTFSNYAKLVFAANELPPSEDYSYAYFRRWCIIEFPNVFNGVDCNQNMIKDITTPEELSGLLNKCLIILPELLSRGEFTEGSTKDVEKEYFRRSDSIAAFVNEMLERDNSGKAMSRSELYNVYVGFCDDFELTAKSQREFTAAIPTVASWITSARLGSERGWKGYKIKTYTSYTLFSHTRVKEEYKEVGDKNCTLSTEVNQSNIDIDVNNNIHDNINNKHLDIFNFIAASGTATLGELLSEFQGFEVEVVLKDLLDAGRIQLVKHNVFKVSLPNNNQ